MSLRDQNHGKKKQNAPRKELTAKFSESTDRLADSVVSGIRERLYESGLLPRPEDSDFSTRDNSETGNSNQVTLKTLLSGTKNRGLIFPSGPSLFDVVRGAVAGDSSARQAYDESRHIVLNQIPGYAKETILQIAQSHFARTSMLERTQALMILIDDKVAGANRSYRRLVKSGVGEKNCLQFEPGYLDLWELFPRESPNAAREFQLTLQVKKYRDKYEKPDFNSNREVSLSMLFDYENPNPHGRHARDAALEIISYVLKVRVFEDFMAAEGIPLSANIKNRLLKSYDDQWGILESVQIRKVITFHQELLRTLAPNNENLHYYLMCTFGLSSNPLEEYRKYCEERADRIELDFAQSSQPKQNANAALDDSVIREKPWVGLEFKIRSLQREPDNLESRKAREHVIRLCALTSFPEEKAIRRLEHEDSIGKLIDELQRKKGLVFKVTSQEIDGKHDLISGPSSEIEPKKVDFKVYLWSISGGSSSVKSEIDLLDRSVRQDIYTTFAKLEGNNQGDHKKVKGSKVFELRSKRHGGLRIYYMTLEPLEAYIILRIGNKDTQPNDISIAVGRAKTVRPNSREELLSNYERAIIQDGK